MTATATPPPCVRLLGSELIAPSFIRDVCQGQLPASAFDEVARDRAMRVYLLASMYPHWTAARCIALADEPGTWTLVGNAAEFRPADPSFWTRWEGK